MRALVTGGESGIGRAIVERLRHDGADVRSLDIRTGFDVGDPAAWADVEAVDLACLNAGVVTGESDIAALTDEAYRRAVAVNVHGVVYGARRMAQVMDRGGAIVVTASLGGVVPIGADPIYSMTKHAVVGLVRSLAPQLRERGLRINAVCPGWADTALLPPEQHALFGDAGYPLIEPDRIAEAVLLAARDDDTGQAWLVVAGREPLKFRFPNVPGPRGEGEGKMPPLM